MAGRRFEELLAAARRAAVWVDALVVDCRVEYSRYYKEVYVVAGRHVFVFKLVERRWPVPPRLFRRYASPLLERGKRFAKHVVPVVLAHRLTVGALRLAKRLRWLALLPLSLLDTPQALAYWVREKVRELLDTYRWMKRRTLDRTLEVLVEKLAEELEKRRRGPPVHLEPLNS